MRRAILMVLVLVVAGCGGTDGGADCSVRICQRSNAGGPVVEVAACDRSGPDRYCTIAPGDNAPTSCSWAATGETAPANDFVCAGL